MNRLRFSKDQRYIYSVGRIRVLERYLLTVTDLERLIESESFSASIRHLAESRAYEHFGGKEDLAGVETLLLAEQEKNSNLAGEMAIQKALKDIISLEAGALDRVKLQAAYETALASGLDFLAEYLSRRIDWLNIILFLRLREYIRREGLLKDNLISHGLIPLSLYLKWYEAAAQDFLGELPSYGYSLRSLSPLAQVEKQAEDYLIRFLKPAKYEGFGYEPVLGYFLGREREFKNLRIILFGKFYNLSNAAIRENIRELYV
jgi:vacuolar-type H+-ATPase subunit C/Vma6